MIRSTLPLVLIVIAVMPLVAQSDSRPKLLSGDASFAGMEYPSAVRDYELALGETPQDPQIFWRLSRAYVCMGEVEEDASRRSKALKAAETYARNCIALSPGSEEGHTWLAAALGYLALEAGMQDQIALSRELLEETGKALALNPKNDVALSIRGSFFHALGNVGWVKRQLAGLFIGEIPSGGYAEAESSLLEAIAIAPGIMRHHYELGILYLDMDRIPEACAAFDRASRLPVRVAIDRPRLVKIRAYLVQLQCNNK
jgi:tetratricopeptide (TPR) repeat protein